MIAAIVPIPDSRDAPMAQTPREKTRQRCVTATDSEWELIGTRADARSALRAPSGGPAADSQHGVARNQERHRRRRERQVRRETLAGGYMTGTAGLKSAEVPPKLHAVRVAGDERLPSIGSES